jgi:transposase
VATFYAEIMRRPGLPPGMYFRLLWIGYFEGIDSERGIAWRAADSFALRDFLGVGLEDPAPDHSTISRTFHSRVEPERWPMLFLHRE